MQGNLSKSERAQALHILASPGLKRSAKVWQVKDDFSMFQHKNYINIIHHNSTYYHSIIDRDMLTYQDNSHIQ